MCISNGEQEVASQARSEERRRQLGVTRAIGKVDKAFEPFGADYLEKRRGEFFQANLPALMANFRAARDRATFAQARRGQIGTGGATSSAAINQNRALFSGMNGNRADLMARAFDFADMEKSRLRGVRSDLVSEIRGAWDPGAAIGATRLANELPAGAGPTPALFANISGIAGDIIRPPKPRVQLGA